MNKEKLTDVELVEQLRAKAQQSVRYNKRGNGSPRSWNDHVCWKAADRLEALAKSQQGTDEPFQVGVGKWMVACFTPEIIADKLERSDRFIEESLELVQATGYSAERAHALVDYVFGRERGEPSQEVGGVMVTLAALCNPHGLNMDGAAETELARVWTKIDKIRAKQATKPVGSALPIPAQETDEVTEADVERVARAIASVENNATGNVNFWGDFSGEEHRSFHTQARAAIAAMRKANDGGGE